MKMLPLLLVLCFILTLAACSKEEKTEMPEQASQATEEAAPAMQPAEKMTQETEAAPTMAEQAEQAAKDVAENVGQVAQQVEEKAKDTMKQVMATLDSGQAVYSKACSSCHKIGIAGAPKTGDKEAWSSRIAGGTEKMVTNAINGLGSMPPKGGVASLTDEEVAAAVEYMVEQSR